MITDSRYVLKLGVTVEFNLEGARNVLCQWRRSLVQRCPTKCLNKIKNLPSEAAKVLTRRIEPLVMTMMMMIAEGTEFDCVVSMRFRSTK
jgi:hypothetical protein